MYRICLFILKFFSKMFFPYRIEGKENLKTLEGTFLVCSNHVSNFDPIFISLGLNRKVYFLAKSELFKNKLFSFLLKKLGAVPIRRGQHDVEAINFAKNLIKSGKILGIFIEGTRSRTGKFLRPHSGATLISYETGSSILPVCITPKNGKFLKIFTRTRIQFGAPIEKVKLEEGSYREIRAATNSIMEEIIRLRSC